MIQEHDTRYGLYSRLRFGKHFGETVQEVIVNDPEWLEWALDNVVGMKLTPEAEKELDVRM